MEAYSKEIVKRAIEDIQYGAGWSTDLYILEHCDDLTEIEQFKVMMGLANLGLLVDEALADPSLLDEGELDKDALMSYSDVLDNYKYLLDNKEDVEEPLPPEEDKLTKLEDNLMRVTNILSNLKLELTSMDKGKQSYHTLTRLIYKYSDKRDELIEQINLKL